METQNEPLGSFVCELGKVDTSRPVPIEGSYVCKLIKIEQKPAKPDSGGTSPGNNAFFTFATMFDGQAVPDSTGNSKVISAGYQMTECCVMWQGPNPKQPDWKVKICQIYDALAGTNDETRPERQDWNALVGKPLTLFIKPEESGDYGLQPRIKKYGPPPAGV